MPSYSLYPLGPQSDPQQPVETVAFNDAAAIRWAMRRTFPHGCDIFLGSRFVARVHVAAAMGLDADPEEPLE